MYAEVMYSVYCYSVYCYSVYCYSAVFCGRIAISNCLNHNYSWDSRNWT